MRVIAFDIFICPRFGILAQNDGVGPPGIGPFANGNGVFSPGPAVLADSNGMGRGPGSRSQGNAVIPPGSSATQSNGILSRSIGTGTYRSGLVSGRLGSITYSRARIGSLGFCAYAGTLVSHTGILAQSHPIGTCDGSIGSDGRTTS